MVLIFSPQLALAADAEQLKTYENRTFIVYQILLGIAGITILVTAIMVSQHYGFKHLFKSLVVLAIIFLIFIAYRIWG